MRLEHLLSGARDSEEKEKGTSRGMNEKYLVLQVGYEKIENREKDEAGKPAKLTVL